jgi:adenine deaminase
MTTFSITGYLVDIPGRAIRPSRVTILDGKIDSIEPVDKPEQEAYIIPGLVDSHIHIESSMLSPQQFARVAVTHGTVATVSDPHEIANVLGEKGINYMVKSGSKVPLKFHFGVPSCVPATPFETSGAVLDGEKVAHLLADPRFFYLAEMMNFPGVIGGDSDVKRKLQAAVSLGKPIDGHAPGVTGDDLKKYVAAGISTDHECSTYEEAVEKIRQGMKIQIREGSAARDFDALCRLIDEYPDRVMLCSDDRHPDDLLEGHIDALIRKGLSRGLDFYHLLQAATFNPVEHYGLSNGLLRVGDPADLVLIDDPNSFRIQQVYIDGQEVYDGQQPCFEVQDDEAPNIMQAGNVSSADIEVEARSNRVRVIHAHDHQLYTSSSIETMEAHDGLLHANPDNDLLKIVVLNRYKPQKPSVAFVRNFGLQRGAIGTSIAHDSHNLIAVGADDHSIREVLKHLIQIKGGMAVYDQQQVHSLGLEIAGLMTHQPAHIVAQKYTRLSELAREMGCNLEAPFMTLSFMALPVIPELKITDQGLFDVNAFRYTSLFDTQ